MLYNRLTDSELERAVYVDPTNAAASAELLKRAPAAIADRLEDCDVLEGEMEQMAAEHRIEVENLQEDLRDAEQHGRDLAAELDESKQSVEELEAAVSVHAKEIDWLRKQFSELKDSHDVANAIIDRLTHCEDLV